MKIAVIGAGIFGSSAAIKLGEAGYEVHLYERYPDILQAASTINQYRLHRGYHYPRSKPTAVSAVSAEPLFKKEYKDAIVTSRNHFYAIAKEKSFVNGKQFMKFLDACNLPYKKAKLSCVDKTKIDVLLRAEEDLLNPLTLRGIIKVKLKHAGVRLHLNTLADAKIFKRFDLVVNATYANFNFILEKYPEARREYQFEVCEKVLLKLPRAFKNISLVVMDGPFMCIDPYDETGFHVMGNVVHAIHRTNNGFFPDIPKEFVPLLNRGVIKNPPITNIEKFLESAAYFMPGISKAEHLGSMYTVRTVLPHVEKTDERPTFVYKVNDKLINIFSGKLGNSVQAAIETLDLVEKIRSDRG